MVRLKTIIKPISQKTESEIIKLLSLSPPTCYARTDENLINNISSKLFVSKSLVTSAKSAHIKNKMIKNHHKLESNIDSITKLYEKQCMPILKLSEKFDGSPLNIIRIIFKKRYPDVKIKEILNSPEEFLSPFDKEQFDIAMANDIYAPIDNGKQLENSMEFEHNVEKILVDNNVTFKTQEELVEIQMKEFGKPICTPDFLITNDLI